MAEKVDRFSCLRCGKCCEGLVAEDKGVLRGLTLLPEKAPLFPPDMVRPAMGVGRRPHGEGFRVIAYQLEADVCPHLSEGLCCIYVDRPASCRQFPFSLEPGRDGPIVGLDMNCPGVPALLSGEGRLEIDELGSAEALYRLKVEVAENPQRFWFYDLRNRKWVRADSLV
ncbi:MAG TPA: YkgJ family cysteine cluster protein [Candidatus Desulfaltia sp.]|nr:YkgJ family cysteine cluster protein [Candidatus Desulfaltia sp.]